MQGTIHVKQGLDVGQLHVFTICLICVQSTHGYYTRRQFMVHLIDKLCRNVPNENMTTCSNVGQLELNMKSSRRKCQNSSCGNKTSNQCEECKKFYCGKHIASKVQSFYCINCSK